MFHNKDHVVLLREVQVDIAKLEEAIRNISYARHNLKHNSMEVKADIQTTITQQLESLRERELYLLQQVDLAHQAKEAVLQGQEDQLHEVLGGLNNVLKLEEARGGSASIGDHVKDTLKSLKNLALHPKETSNLAFKANVARLSNTISDFGSIDIRALPLNSMFDDESASTSLPRAFEDYEDEDHHVLYKTVGGSHPDGGVNKISINIPRLSKKPEDWLFMPSDQMQSHTATTPSPTTIPMFSPFLSTNVAGWIAKHDKVNHSMSSAASIHQWLCDIQGQGEEEETEADFEVITPPPCNKESTQGSSIEVLGSEDAIFFMTTPVSDGYSGVSMTSEFSNILAYFTHIKAASNEKWLLDGVNTSNESSASYCNEVLSYFRDISKDTKDWLLEYTKKKNHDSSSPCSPEKPCKLTPSPVDIENLDQLVCVQDPVSRYFDEINPDPKCWLLDAKDEDMDMDETQGYGAPDRTQGYGAPDRTQGYGNPDVTQDYWAADVKVVCKANEPCQTFNECLSDENCCNRLGKVSQHVKNSENNGSGYFHKFDHFDAVKKQSASVWLPTENMQIDDPKACNDTQESNVLFPPFVNPCHVQSWLIASQTSRGSNDLSVPTVLGLSKKSLDREVAPNPWLNPQEDVSNMDIERLTSDWEAMFCHDTCKGDTPPNFMTQPKLSVSEGEGQGLGMWLVSTDQNISDYAKTDPSFKKLCSFSERYLGFGNDNLGPWLLEPESDNYSESSMKPEKETGKSCGKAAELPECEDEPLEDTKSVLTDALFACFHKKSLGNQSWLLQPNPLID